MKQTIKLSDLKAVVAEAHEKLKGMKGGANADYIPFLAKIDPNLFGIAISLPSGEIIEAGDTNYVFGIESISKVHTAILVLRQYGAEALLEKIGADATGLPFNSIMAILLEKDHPSTPLVNSGAIAADSMVKPVGDSNSKWSAIIDNMTDLCGSEPILQDELYKSETATNFNNRSIAWLLKNYDRIYDDPDMALDLYTRQCSMGVTAKQLAISGCTIANKGKNPVTGKQVFDENLAPQIISLIATVGFYEHTGDWLYTSGIPAKTGVGGGVMGILPGAFGIAAFAPPLDEAGNSVKAQAAIKYIAQKLKVNVFNGNSIEITE
ncbi:MULTISPECIES: glutaminase A [Sanguibacteroides]|uniref:Glutaminase n=1 Tax=Sanguibacteroides justesenii TaxID=1547597 RepID=A0A0C3RH60_9PORP|nr:MULTISPECIES: glutaminase A [Sanguibacteroides]KIO43266.1 glutaminase [Sanguibacteroides justesenii]KIO44979.1 glutaminase [Sanguibacteroides justesenii]PXZ42863.1 glutaminase [Sanguibacteroides justesenii]